MKKFLGRSITVLFLLHCIILIVMRLLRLQLISFIAQDYWILTSAVLCILFFKVFRRSNETFQNVFVILTPLLYLISLQIQLIILSAFFAFSVYDRYERTKLNIFLKKAYPVIFVIALANVVFLPTALASVQESWTDSHHISYSSDNTYMIQIRNFDRSQYGHPEHFKVILSEKVFKIFHRELLRENLRYPKSLQVTWLDDKQVQVNHIVYSFSDHHVDITVVGEPDLIDF